MARRAQAARHRERRADRRRRLARLGVAACGAALAIAGAWSVLGALKAAEFPIRSVQVEGRFSHVQAERVSRIVAPYAAAGFFRTDVAAVKQALEALPWVDATAVRRVWPDVLHVTVLEQRPVARWGERALVNARGEVFAPRGRADDLALPALQGPPGSAPQVLAFYRQAREVVAPLEVALARVHMDERRAWRLELENGIAVTLGREQGIERLRRFARFYPRVVGRRVAEVAGVDLRYTNGFAVRWRRSGGEALSASRERSEQETGDNA